MAAPLFKVEVAFADGPNAAAPTYTDISAYVRRDPPLTYSRGTVDEVPDLQAGTMTFTVDNSNGRFTPGSTASTSAWGTVLKIRRPVRLSIWNGTTYVVQWVGTVDDWGTGWVNGVQGRTRVTCSDKIARAGRITLRSMVENEYLADSPTAYFTLAESTRATTWGDVSGVTPTYSVSASGTVGAGSGTITPGTGTGPGYDGLTATIFTPTSSTNGKFLTDTFSTVKALASAATGTIECFVNTSTAAAQTILEISGGFGVANDSTRLGVDASGKLTAVFTRNNVGSSLTSAGTLSTGATRHIAVTWSTAATTTTFTLYLDGASVGTTTLTNGVFPTYLLGIGGGLVGATALTGTVAHCATYATALSATRILAHANAGLNGVTGELSGTRWNRLCGYVFGSTTYTADAGTSTMGPQPISGQTLAAALQQVVEAEQGTAYCAADGKLTLKGRAARYAVASSLTIAPTTIGQDIEFVTNDAYLINDVQVARVGGGTFAASNSASKTEYDTARESVDIYVNTDDQAQQLANWKVYVYGTPQTRARQFTIGATAKAATITATQVLALDVGVRVTLSPLTGPSPSSSVDLFIEGLTGTLGSEWSVTYNTSPLNQSGSVMILDDATYGQLDTGGVLAF